MHHRSGDMPAGFGMVNGEALPCTETMRPTYQLSADCGLLQVDVRADAKTEVLRLLTCAHSLERYLKLPSTTRCNGSQIDRSPWYLSVFDLPLSNESRHSVFRSQGGILHLTTLQWRKFLRPDVLSLNGSFGMVDILADFDQS